MPITTAKGTSEINAEIQHLLNHKSILTARGIQLTDVQRFSLLREIAGELAFLHRNGICVGDISPKNLLFALSPSAAAYFIDCDTMSVNGVSALPQVETPGWEVPEGEELATIYSDSYKLGLLALRLLVGDQDTRDPKRIPAKTPSMLQTLIRDSLTNKAERRPLPTAWTYILGHAIEEAQQRELDFGGEDDVEDSPTPPVPVVRSRPQAKTKSAVSTTRPAPTPPPAPTVEDHDASPTPATDLRRRNHLIGAAIAAAAVLAVILVSVLAVSSSDGSSTNRTARSTSSNAYDEPTLSRTRPATTTIQSTAASIATQTGSRGTGTPTPAGMQWRFQSPTGNIACDLDGTIVPAVAACEVRDHFYKPEVRPDCVQQWTNRFTLTESGGVRVECYPGSNYGSGLPQQDYGKPLTVGSLTCVLDYSLGVTCRDSASGHWFQAARQEYKWN